MDVGFDHRKIRPTEKLDLSLGVIHPSLGRPSAANQPSAAALWTYPAPMGLDKLRRVIARDIGISKSRTAITAGASMALSAVFIALQAQGPVLIPRPGFPGYRKSLNCLRLAYIAYDTSIRQPVFDSIQAALERKSGAGSIVISNPGNPFGTVLTRAQVDRLAQLARHRGIQPIIDETYRGLIFDGPEVGLPSRPVKGAVQIFSFSKAPRLAGARLGYVVARPDLLGRIMQAHSALSMGASLVSQQLCLKVWQTRGTVAAPELLGALRQARDFCVERLQAAGLDTSVPLATPVIWIEFPGVAGSSADIAGDLWRHYGLQAEISDSFGVFNRSAIRCCFALEKHLLKAAIGAIADYARHGIRQIQGEHHDL